LLMAFFSFDFSIIFAGVFLYESSCKFSLDDCDDDEEKEELSVLNSQLGIPNWGFIVVNQRWAYVWAHVDVMYATNIFRETALKIVQIRLPLSE